MAMDYSEKVMEHFAHPHNVGVIEDADGVGEVGNAKCGDIMKMYLKIRDGIIEDVKFQTFGCASAIATSSMATDLIMGKPVEDALKLTNQAGGGGSGRSAGGEGPLLRSGRAGHQGGAGGLLQAPGH